MNDTAKPPPTAPETDHAANDKAASTGDNEPRTPPGPTVDTLFGEITIRLDGQDRLTVDGEQIPTVVLERDPATEPDPLIAIGTRDPAALTLTVDGAPARITPGKGKLRRQTYRVDVEHADAHYRFQPDSVPSSRLTRDGIRLGDFSSDGDETVIAEWQADATPTATDAALGYTLAAAFGTGGQPMWMMIVDTVSAALP
ncbi:hypothetical protein ACH4SP_14780 [Streptomyces sp. NPDC021093]|uniref:hypothetical protein n=1 Tax=Streptomyces sp. NPDC021093 TaxID=3365112 RepID=UPI00379A528E